MLVQHYAFGFWHYRPLVGDLVNAPALSEALPIPNYLRWLWTIQPFELGQFGVGLFFLISGFVLPFAFQNMGWRGFAIGRIARIYPTYAAGFICTVLGIWACSAYFDRSFPFDPWRVAIHFFPGIHDLTLSRGIDGIIWTLNIELKFYLVCLLAIPLFRRGSLKVFLIPLALSMLAWLAIGPVAAAGGSTAARGSVLWLAIFFIDFMFVGVVFHFWIRRWLSFWQGLALVAALLVAMHLVWWKSLPIKFEYAWSYGASLIFFSIAFRLRASTLFKPRRLTEFFADISYPLYVVHGVLGFAIIRVALAAGWPASAALAIAACLTVALAAAIHFIVETPTHKWGRRMAQHVSARRAGDRQFA
ncbi:peptidoglycan/LPS O-acetylase OafA/YrhL [Variovorax guangxiensis]|nr:peptidoglycan/LPS O-acetylase OafA/YrhL [Variovorax guangxiensis]